MRTLSMTLLIGGLGFGAGTLRAEEPAPPPPGGHEGHAPAAPQEAPPAAPQESPPPAGQEAAPPAGNGHEAAPPVDEHAVPSKDEQDVTLTYHELTPRDRVVAAAESWNLQTRENYCFWRQVRIYDQDIPPEKGFKGAQVAKVFENCAQQLVKESKKESALLDTNGDGTGDEEWKITATKPVVHAFPLTYETGLKRDYHAQVITFHSFNWGKGSKEVITDGYIYKLSLRRACFMKGSVDGADFYLIDENSNGRFNDYGQDAVVFGKSEAAVPLSRVMLLGDQWRTIAVTDDGVKLTVGDYAGELGLFELQTNYPQGGEPQYAVFQHQQMENVFLDLSDWEKPAKGKRKAKPKSENKKLAAPGERIPEGQYKLVRGILGDGKGRERGVYCYFDGGFCPPINVNHKLTKAVYFRLGFSDKLPKGKQPFEVEFSASFQSYQGFEAIHVSGWGDFRQMMLKGVVSAEKYHTFLPEPYLFRWEVYTHPRGGKPEAKQKTAIFGSDKTWAWESVMYPDIQTLYWGPTKPGTDYFVKVLLDAVPFFGNLESEIKQVVRP